MVTTFWKKKVVSFVAVLAAAGGWAVAAPAARQVAAVSWVQLQQQGKLKTGEVLPPGDDRPFAVLRIAKTDAGPHTVQVTAIDRPAITTTQYAIRGQVRCVDVEGEGYLEMWSVFPQKQRAFSRGLSPSGPLGSLKGTSPWRRFVLPFFMNGSAKERPERLEFNVALPGRGVVEIGPVELVEYPSPEAAMADVSGTEAGWWSAGAGVWIGIGLGGMGVLLGAMGALAGLLAPRGRCRGLVMGIMKAMLVIGVAALVIGIVALVKAQPYWVYYPLLLGGGVAAAISLIVTPALRWQYQQHELRKMQALDTAQG